MWEIGLEPDGVDYTNVIVAYRKKNNINKCWELYEDCDLHGLADEQMISYMMRLCAATHDAEKGLWMWHRL